MNTDETGLNTHWKLIGSPGLKPINYSIYARNVCLFQVSNRGILLTGTDPWVLLSFHSDDLWSHGTLDQGQSTQVKGEGSCTLLTNNNGQNKAWCTLLSTSLFPHEVKQNLSLCHSMFNYKRPVYCYIFYTLIPRTFCSINGTRCQLFSGNSWKQWKFKWSHARAIMEFVNCDTSIVIQRQANFVCRPWKQDDHELSELQHGSLTVMFCSKYCQSTDHAAGRASVHKKI